MQGCKPQLFLGTVWLLLGWCSWLSAEELPAARREPSKTAPAVEPIQESPLTIHLKDKDGRLIPMLDWSFEDFIRVYQENRGFKQRDETPAYSLQSMSITGAAKGDYAELSIEFGVLVRDGQWTRVPLRLNQAILREGVKYAGPGQQFVGFEAAGDGYVSWIHGASAERHRLTMNVMVPLASVGEETRLKLSVPRATSSELKLTVPLAKAFGQVAEGSTLASKPANGGAATEFDVLGLGGDFEISWRKSASAAAEGQPVLEAVGAISARVDSRLVNTEAVLTVRAFGGLLDHFRVRLPQGSELVAGNPMGYTVVPSAAKGAAADAREVEVRFPRKVSGPVEVRLATRQTYEAAPAGGWFELAGFEVVEAGRQWGHFAISVVGDLHVVWGPDKGVRQVDELPEPLRRENLLAGFEYFTQPFSLTARVVSRKTRLSVEPEYVFLVEPDQVRLKAKLKYTVRGAKTSALDVILPDWTLDEVGPDNLVAVDAVATGPKGTVSIPLTTPSIGPLEIDLRAHKRLEPGAKSVSFAMPQPQNGSVSPAAVVVLPADNVELSTDSKATIGLIRQQNAPPMSLPERQQAPWFYRAESPKAVFAAAVTTHSQSVGVDVASEVQIVGQKALVEEKISYAVAYQPLDKVSLQVPRSLLGSDKIEISIDGQPLSLSEPADAADKPGEPGPVLRRLLLPSPRIGTCELVVRYPIALEKLLPEAGISASVPLVMPLDGKLTSNRALVTANAGVRVQLLEGPWTVVDPSVPELEHRQGQQLAATQRSDRVVLGIHLEDRDALGATIVERAWIQTVFLDGGRQDRAVLRFTSDQRELSLAVPAGIDPGKVEVWLDRQRVEGTPAGGKLTIELPEGFSQGSHWLEASYRFPAGPAGRGWLSLELPHLGRDVWVRRLYWQLVLPRNEHVIASPAGMLPEFTWGWNGSFFGRNPSFEQPMLEVWSGGQHRTPVPFATSRYVYSSLQPVERCELRTANRTWIVLFASGLVLIGGLVLIYVPATRHPAALLLAAIVLGSLAVLYPEPTLLAAQAASLGLAAAFLAALLQRIMLRRRLGLRDSASSLLDKGSTQTLYPSPSGSRPGSTESKPAVASLPAAGHPS